MTRNTKDHHLYDFLIASYPEGLYIKDLVDADLNRVQWLPVVSTPDAILLRMRKDQLGSVMENLIMNGLGPAQSCAILQVSNNRLRHVFSSAGEVALRGRGIIGTVLHLLIAENMSRLLPRSETLSGKTVLVTRAQKQAPELTSLLKKRGARVIEVPAIEIVVRQEKKPELLQALGNIADYSWLILTSVNTVLILDQLMKEVTLDWRVFEKLSIATIGRSTAAAVRERGANVSLIPPLFQAESLVDELLKQGIAGVKILLPRAEGSRRILPDSLEQAGATVNEIQIYRAEIPITSRTEFIRVLTNQRLDYITFTSSSTVNHFVEIAGDLLNKLDFQKTRLACIGPVTAATLQEHGIAASVQAKEFTIRGLVKALERDSSREY